MSQTNPASTTPDPATSGAIVVPAPKGPWWKGIRIDGFLVAIITAAVIATFLPARGTAVPIFSWTSKIMVAVLFFMYGARLKRAEAITGLKHWRLHGVILAFTYLLFPLIGLAMRPLVPEIISPELYRGIIWVCIVPSTVQSSINFTSIARGNVAGAVVSASLSNLLGVFITPLLAMGLMSATGLHIKASSILDISAQVLAPFVLGQLSRKWTADFFAAHKKLKLFDQATIVLVVYIAFSAGVRNGIWQSTSVSELGIILLVCLVILAVMLWLTWQVADWLGFNRRDQIAIQFCGTKKSLTTGVPMASVLFPAASVGLIVLPLMIFHQAQLMACGWLAGRYANHSEEWHDLPGRKAQSTSALG